MRAFVFELNNKIVGIFDNIEKFIEETTKYIIKSLSDKGYFKGNENECKEKLKDDLDIFAQTSNYTFAYNDMNYGKTTIVMNSLKQEENREEEFSKFVLDDIRKDICLFSIDRYLD
jgi:hypothetical protein